MGRLFHYVLTEGVNKGQCRPMIVVREWSPGMVNGLVFVDGLNDGALGVGRDSDGNDLYGLRWVRSVARSRGAEPGRWHSWNDCPSEQRIGALTSKETAFLASERDVIKGNPAITHVIRVPGLEIPWPDGMTLANAIRAWAIAAAADARNAGPGLIPSVTTIDASPGTG